jgi:hypothetical protein
MKISYSQNKFLEREGFEFLVNDTLIREIASFNKYGSSILKQVYEIKLEEIQLDKCTDRFARFEKGNIFSSELEIIISKGKTSSKKIEKISILFGKYWAIYLPDSALVDIYDPILCELSSKKRKYIKTNSKVFYSQDKRRLYIYMQNGQDANKYEITWVVKDKKYHTRIINLIR